MVGISSGPGVVSDNGWPATMSVRCWSSNSTSRRRISRHIDAESRPTREAQPRSAERTALMPIPGPAEWKSRGFPGADPRVRGAAAHAVAGARAPSAGDPSQRDGRNEGRPPASWSRAGSGHDASGAPGIAGVFAERLRRLEARVLLDRQPGHAAGFLDLQKVDVAHLGAAQISESEGKSRLCRIHLCQEPDGARTGDDQLHDRLRIEQLVAQLVLARETPVGQQQRELRVGDEGKRGCAEGSGGGDRGHGRLLDGCGRDCPGPCRVTRQRSAQASKTAAGRKRAWRAPGLTARTAWHDEGHSKPAHPYSHLSRPPRGEARRAATRRCGPSRKAARSRPSLQALGRARTASTLGRRPVDPFGRGHACEVRIQGGAPLADGFAHRRVRLAQVHRHRGGGELAHLLGTEQAQRAVGAREQRPARTRITRNVVAHEHPVAPQTPPQTAPQTVRGAATHALQHHIGGARAHEARRCSEVHVAFDVPVWRAACGQRRLGLDHQVRGMGAERRRFQAAGLAPRAHRRQLGRAQQCHPAPQGARVQQVDARVQARERALVHEPHAPSGRDGFDEAGEELL
ncbi:unnamed protein product, partial [Brugia timori]|uniref:LigA n=1 Tax=Brugia timori TaxID=42155 RepID=A0A0R3QPD1_9BILA